MGTGRDNPGRRGPVSAFSGTGIIWRNKALSGFHALIGALGTWTSILWSSTYSWRDMQGPKGDGTWPPPSGSRQGTELLRAEPDGQPWARGLKTSRLRRPPSRCPRLPVTEGHCPCCEVQVSQGPPPVPVSSQQAWAMSTIFSWQFTKHEWESDHIDERENLKHSGPLLDYLRTFSERENRKIKTVCLGVFPKDELLRCPLCTWHSHAQPEMQWRKWKDGRKEGRERTLNKPDRVTHD